MIDTHAHLLARDQKKYPPSPPSGEIKPSEFDDPMTAEKLLEEMDKNGVEKAVLVQRGSVYGFDNSYVCDSAAEHPDRFVAVCSIDATSDDGASAVRYWVSERGAAGVRLMELVRGADISWLYSPLAMEVWREAVKLEAPVCVHLFPWNRSEGLNSILKILEELSDAAIVLDHFSNMNSQAGAPDHGVDELLEAVAAFPRVFTKFTTIPLGRLEKAQIDTAPIVKRVVDLFGAERVMWGSDISQSEGSYDYMVGLAQRAVSLLSDADRENVLRGAAMNAYERSFR